jgi:hypothetical protein
LPSLFNAGGSSTSSTGASGDEGSGWDWETVMSGKKNCWRKIAFLAYL